MTSKALTPAETNVLLTYCQLETHALAAQALQISPQTLKNHLGNIYKKKGARKAHSALYRHCLDQGFDPLGAVDTTSPLGPGVHVNSESTTMAGEIGGKYRESPASDPILEQEVGIDTKPSELSSVLTDDNPSSELQDLPPILDTE